MRTQEVRHCFFPAYLSPFDICLNVGIDRLGAFLCNCQLGMAASDIYGEALAPTKSCLLLR